MGERLHRWEFCTGGTTDGEANVYRLSVPGGWLYEVGGSRLAFVPRAQAQADADARIRLALHRLLCFHEQEQQGEGAVDHEGTELGDLMLEARGALQMRGEVEP